jgi:hypothetical protein
MVCLSWKGIESCPEAALQPCPKVNWFWWLVAGAAALVALSRKKEKKS